MRILLLLLLLPALSFAQSVKISGRVFDQVGNDPLAGATILERGTANGTVADAEGKFAMMVGSDTTTLQISFVGYRPLLFSLKGISALHLLEIGLEADDKALSEFVVTALGIERDKKALGYAVQQLDAADISLVRESNLTESLAGRLAGVQVSNGSSGVGSSVRVVIRGETSLSGTNQALFVVDGVPISNELITNNTENIETGFQEVDYGNGAGELNPDDIASISVLKGPAAAALYGSRAANGVVLITTKTGRGTSGIGVSVNSSVTFESPLRLPRYQNAYGQGDAGAFAYEDGFGAGISDGSIRSYGPKIEGQLIPQFNSPSIGPNGEPLRGGDIVARAGADIQATPWVANPNNVSDFFQTGNTYINNVALSGSNQYGNFRLSYTNLENKGIIPNTDLSRNSVALSSGYCLTEKLHVKAFINYINSASTHRPGTGYGSENPMYIFTWMGRQVNMADLKDYWQAGQEGFRQFNFNYLWMDNPYLAVFENTNSFNKDRVLGNLSLTYELAEGLGLRLRAGTDAYHDLRESRRAFSSQRFREGGYREDIVDFREVNADLLLTYTKKFGEIDFTGSAGANRMDQQVGYKSLMAARLSLPGIYSFENSKVPLERSQYRQQKRLNSVYSNMQFGYKNMLFLDLSFRNDWSSALPANSNSYGYYAASAGAVISDMVKLPAFIGYAKLRASYASVGNDTDPYKLNNTFLFSTTYGDQPAVTNGNALLNSQLRPERLNALEGGLDIRFFGGRLGLDVSAYNNVSKDQIIQSPTSVASGYVSRLINGGKIRNQGIEAILSVTPVAKGNFQWTASFNFSRNVSRIVELPEGVEQYVMGYTRVYNNSDRSVFYIARAGGRMGDMYGTGLLTVDGQHVYDAAGNPVKDPNLRVLGNYNPDFMLGFANQISYKGLTLGFLFDWRYGGTIVSRTLAIGSTSGVLENTLEGRETGIVGQGLKNIGTTANPQYVPNDVVIPALNYYNQYYDRDNEASALYSASYLKLRQLSLSCQLPNTWAQKMRVAGATVSLIGNNLAVWTENPHIDPELSAMQGRRFAYGVEDMSYPSSRSWGFSLKLRL